MSRVRIVTDSTADIPKELVEKLGIVVVPLKINIGSEVYRDGVDITPGEFTACLGKSRTPPTTSPPSPGEFVAVYERLIDKGEYIVSIHLSEKLSGTIHSAKTAKTMIDSRDIYIVDSKAVSMGLGLTVLAAAQAAREGAAVREVLSLIKEKIERSLVLFYVDNLDYLEKDGTIGKAHTFLGTLLKIKPILIFDNGQLVPVEKVRGKSRGLERIIQIITERTDVSKRYDCAIVFGNSYAPVNNLSQRIPQVINCGSVFIGSVGTAIMAHTGPGVIGIAISPE